MNPASWFRKQSIRLKIFIPFFAISLLTSTLFTVYGFVQNKHAIINEIDKRLLIAALTMEQILPPGYFNRVQDPYSIGEEEHMRNTEDLCLFLENVGATYLYALYKHEEKYYFVASAALDFGYWVEYEQPAPNIFEIEKNWRPHISTTMDPAYGLLRSVVIPIEDSQGRHFIVGADIHAHEVAALMRRAFLNFFVMGVASFVMAIVFSYLASCSITRPLARLSSFTRTLVESNFSSTVRLDSSLFPDGNRTGAETAILAFDFDQMQRNLEAHIDQLKITQSARERAESELRIAGQIQETFLPSAFDPAIFNRRVQLHASMKTAKQAGGDLFDFFPLGPDHLFFAVGDVSGKGMPAAMFMSAVVVLLRSAAKLHRDPAEILRHVNDDLADRNESCTFVTLLVGILDVSSGEIVVANGGHNPPRILAADGSLSTLPVKTNVVAGVMGGRTFARESFSLRPGDTLFLYTDGVTEAMDVAESLYGEDRMDRTLSSLSPDPSAAEIVRKIADDVSSFAGDHEQADDITMLAIRLESPPVGAPSLS